MESVQWRRSSCNRCEVLVLALFLLLSPALSIRSSLSEDGTFGNLHLGHERQLLGNPGEGLEVELVHRHHPAALGGGRKFSDVGELLRDRILLDAQRQVRQKQQVRASLLEHSNQSSSDPNAGTYEFVSPVESGSSLGSGQYFIDFYLGTPAQKFSVIADTGSDVLWVQCAPCISCYSQVGPVFSPKDSSTYNALTCTAAECQFIPAPINSTTCNPKNPGVCDYGYVYSDGSQSIGVFSTETATMNVSKAGKNVRINNVAFGCGLENSGPSLTAAGGIIGLGQGPLSFPTQIGSYLNNQFSYCLVSYLDAPSISSTLIFGSAGTKSKQQVQSTPFIQNQYLPSLYYVGIQCVHVGGNQLPIPSQVWQINLVGVGGTVVDSGTTVTVFLQPAYLIILNAFVSQINCFPRVAPAQGLEFCFDTSSVSSGDKVSNLPSLSITFDSGAVFNPPNDNIYVSVATNTYCLAIAGSVGPFGYNILGNLIQQNFQITYDRQAQLFSFAPAQCSLS